VLAGDQEQLAAVEGGGAMTLLADRLGYVQLAEPVRFTAAWERAASLRLRSGDATALDEYDQRGRIPGAPPDQAMDQAVRAYVASYLDGRGLGPLPGTVRPDPRRPDPPRPGRRRYVGYQSCDLAYAITGHSAQGATVHTGIALVTGNEDRQWLYPAMTRGRKARGPTASPSCPIPPVILTWRRSRP
jgi:hypothetical protein